MNRPFSSSLLFQGTLQPIPAKYLHAGKNRPRP